jgi:hypothetical protein
VAAFQQGFNAVAPGALSRLGVLTAREQQRLLAGDSDVRWDPASALEACPAKRQAAEEAALRTLLVPQHGYTRDSAPLLLLCKALARMDAGARRAFLRFATGCPHLPPGGLASMQPPITVMRRSDRDTDLTTASTCFRYVKLPAYSSLEVLEARLHYSIVNSEGLIDMS